MTDQDFLTAEDVARYLHVSINTVRWWGSTGRGPRSILLTPKIRRWRSADVEAWLTKRAEEQAS